MHDERNAERRNEPLGFPQLVAGVECTERTTRILLVSDQNGIQKIEVAAEIGYEAAPILRGLRVKTVGIIADGYKSAQAALAARLERIPVGLLTRNQIPASVPAIEYVANAVAHGVIFPRLIKRYPRTSIVRSLLSGDSREILLAAERVFAVARWPTGWSAT